MKEETVIHPGKVLKDFLIKKYHPFPMLIKNAAAEMMVDKDTLSQVLREKRGISQYLASRIIRALPNTTFEFWVDLQNDYNKRTHINCNGLMK